MKEASTRYRLREDYETASPVHVVWELTLACNLKCTHCGSRAGKMRPGELSTEQCFEVIESLKRLGTREVTIIGGEAFLRPDWLEIISKLRSEGIECSMQTGAYNLNEQRIVAAKEAGICNIGISIDGLEDTHNEIRGKSDSFRHAIRGLELLAKHAIPSSVNTVLTKKNLSELDQLLDELIANNVRNWQIQLAVAMGNAVDHSEELLLQPYELVELYERLINIYRRALANNVLIQAGNNIGYYGPYEHIWRQGHEGYFTGCSAGHTALGIEADGTVKGCPSLPTSDYSGGNIKTMRLEDIWNYKEIMFFSRYRNKEELWGGCKSCYYADSCLAGCTWTSHVLFGKRGNNPYCHHRALQLNQKGLREKIRKVKDAPGLSFDNGLFEIVVENEKGEIVEIQSAENVQEVPLSDIKKEPRIPREMVMCHGCDNYVYGEETICPFCEADIAKVQSEYDQKLMDVRKAFEKFEALLNR